LTLYAAYVFFLFFEFQVKPDARLARKRFRLSFSDANSKLQIHSRGYFISFFRVV
jgi:hypothetical protein